jgi:hypothetical protein
MRPHPRRARTNPTSPRAWGTCDRSGFVLNQENMQWQYEWSGTSLVNKRVLVAPDMLDEPNRQLGTFILPPDPPPIMNARPEQYNIDEQPVSTRVTVNGNIRTVIGHGAATVSQRIVSVQGNLNP